MYGIFHIIIQDIIQQVWLEIKAAVDDMFRIGVNPVDVSAFVFFVNLRIHPNVFVDVVNVVNDVNPIDVSTIFCVNLAIHPKCRGSFFVDVVSVVNVVNLVYVRLT